MKKILVIQTAFIGDAILATSVLETLHAGLPEAKIDLLVRKGNELLFEHHPFLNEVLVWKKREEKYKGLRNIGKRIRENNYDVVVNLHRFASSGLLTAFSGAPIKIGYKKNPLSRFFTERHQHPIGQKNDSKFLHEIDRNYGLLKTITTTSLRGPKLYPHPDDFTTVSNYTGRPFITIAAGSVWYTKQWPLEKWKDVIWNYRHYNMFFLGGKMEKEMIDLFISEFPRLNLVNLCGELSLLQSAALMQKATMNFVNDSAPLHLASAMNAPVTAIYCSTIPEFGFGPLSKDSHVIQTQENLACRPCGLHGKSECPEKHFKCALTIKPEQFVQLPKLQ
jgi:lipopolysaccharide heptosyltransferase II